MFDSIPPWMLLVGAGIASSFSSKVREQVLRLLNYLIEETSILGLYSCLYMDKWLEENTYRRVGNRNFFLMRYKTWKVKDNAREAKILIVPFYSDGSLKESTAWYWYKWLPVIVTRKISDYQLVELRVIALRGLIPFKDILECAVLEMETKTEKSRTNYKYGTFCVIRVSGYGERVERQQAVKPSNEARVVTERFEHDEWRYYQPEFHNAVKPLHALPPKLDEDEPALESRLARLSLSAQALRVQDDINFMLKNREWYASRDIPWRYGALLYGPPGTGKTSLIRAIAEQLNIGIYVFDLTTFTNTDFSEAWREKSTTSIARFIVFEDFDAVFEGRKNVANNSALRDSLTFDALLNTIDGMDNSSCDGTILFITTNRIETMDEALLRPGRIDSKVEMTYLSEEGAHFIVDRIMRGLPDDLKGDVLREALATRITPAELQNMCRIAARNYFMANKTAISG